MLREREREREREVGRDGGTKREEGREREIIKMMDTSLLKKRIVLLKLNLNDIYKVFTFISILSLLLLLLFSSFISAC